MIFYGISDVGKMRRSNQDSFLVRELPGGVLLAVVCDGMGGANGGAVASSVAAETFFARCEEQLRAALIEKGDLGRLSAGDYTAMLAHAVADANYAVWKRGEEDATLHGMGTTLVAALIVGRDLYCVNVGDSRLYHIHRCRVTQVTHDHSLVQHLIDTGKLNLQEAKRYPNRNVITRAVGSEQNVPADIFTVCVSSAGGYIVLCTDGLTNYVDSERLLSVMAAESDVICTEEELRARAGELIGLANDAGGSDNITVIAVGYSA